MGARDFQNRRQFCDTISALRPLMGVHNMDLSALIYHTDECMFTKNGMFNRKEILFHGMTTMKGKICQNL